MKSRQVVNATIAAIVFCVVCFALWLHHLELERRGLWMEKIETHKADMERFKQEVESRVLDRWTATDHDKWAKSLGKKNPELRMPEKVTR